MSEVCVWGKFDFSTLSLNAALILVSFLESTQYELFFLFKGEEYQNVFNQIFFQGFSNIQYFFPLFKFLHFNFINK